MLSTKSIHKAGINSNKFISESMKIVFIDFTINIMNKNYSRLEYRTSIRKIYSNCMIFNQTKTIDKVCPKCGSNDITSVDRCCGYLSYKRVKGDSRYNSAKEAEIADRVDHYSPEETITK